LPSVSIANHLACKGLDKIEKTLPMLQQPPEQVGPGLLLNGTRSYMGSKPL